MVILDPVSAKMFTDSIQELQRNIHDEWHHDSYACWKVDRESGWPDGTQVETDKASGSGTGKLYANGSGGPQSSEMVVFVDSPYRFRTLVTAGIDIGDLMVIQVGDEPSGKKRLFRVDVTKPAGIDAVLMDVYLTELFSTPLPKVVP